MAILRNSATIQIDRESNVVAPAAAFGVLRNAAAQLAPWRPSERFRLLKGFNVSRAVTAQFPQHAVSIRP